VIEDTTCLDNSYLTNHVMPKFKELGIQGKFGHIRSNCYLLKSHRPWIK